MPERSHGNFLEPGSPRYLAILFSGSSARASVEGVYGFEAELRRIVRSASHEAAHARLQWWRGELDRLSAGRCEHPLAAALLPLRDAARADFSLLGEMLVAADLDLARFTYRTRGELAAYLFRSAGAAQTLVACALAAPRELAAAEREFARRLGAAVRQYEIVRDMEQDAASGRVYAPLDELDAAGIDPGVLTAPTRPAALQGFVQDWRRRIRMELSALPGLLDSRELRTTQRHGLVLAELVARQLDDERFARPRAHAGRFAPLRRVWTAWRTALRHA